jgi:hypothetical protein
MGELRLVGPTGAGVPGPACELEPSAAGCTARDRSSCAWPGGFNGRGMPEVGRAGLTDTEPRSHSVLSP